VLLIYFLTRESIEKIFRVVSVAFIMTPMVPILDTLFQLFWKYEIAYQYIIPEKTDSLLKNYFLFLIPHKGATPAMRLEILTATFLCGIYVFHKTNSYLKAVMGALLIYSLIFSFGAILFIILWIERLTNFPYDTTPRMMIDIYLLLSIIAIISLFYFLHKDYTKAILKDIRLTRVLHYEMMIVFGIVTGFSSLHEILRSLADIIELFFVFISILFACIFSAITNNIVDIEIDRISNPDRPSVTGTIPMHAYKRIAFVMLCLALIYSFAHNYMTLFLTISFIGGYFIYSMPPLRLKRIPFFSKGLIALNSLIMLLVGYNFAGQKIYNFPTHIAVFVLIIFTACINFIDIKDYYGDKEAGIKTLPVLLGLQRSKIIIGLWFIIGYTIFPYVIGMKELYIPSILSGIAIFFVINKRHYNERLIFVFYLLSGIMFLGYLIMKYI